MAVDTTWTDPSTSGAIDLATGGILTETIYDKILSNLKRLGGTAGLLQVTDAGLMLLNVASNAKMTIGLTIQQGANDDEILAFKSSDVDHGMTTQTETDTFLSVMKLAGADGGVRLVGLSEITQAMLIRGYGVTDDTTKSTAAVAYVEIDAGKKSGTTVTNPATTANMLVIRSDTLTRFIFDATGAAWEDVGTAWTNFDEYDDAHLLEILSIGVSRPDDPIRQQFGQFLAEHRAQLEGLELVEFDGQGGAFLNTSKHAMLLNGAIRQSGQRIAALEQQTAALMAELATIKRALPAA